MISRSDKLAEAKPFPFWQRLALWILFISLLVFPLVVLALPATAMDHGPALCLSRLLFDQECYACGMTRACMRLAHGQVDEAAKFNKLAYIVFPLVAVLYLGETAKLALRLGVPLPGIVSRTIRFLRL